MYTRIRTPPNQTFFFRNYNFFQVAEDIILLADFRILRIHPITDLLLDRTLKF